jgi:hypothetical protein
MTESEVKMNPKKLQAEQLAAEHPDWSRRQLADAVGVSERSIYRYLGPATSVSQDDDGAIELLDPSDVRVLLLDIETALMEVYIWSLGKQYVGPDQIMKDFSLNCWAAKWLYEPRIYSARVTKEEAQVREDGSIMKRLWDLLDKAHYVVAHNADRFDRRKINARFLLNGLPKPSPYQTIDTLKISRRNFALSSHKLDYLQKLLGQTRKQETGYQLWKDAAVGDESALRKMERYCRNDVGMLDELWAVLRPWMSGINVGLFVDTDVPVCPVCGNTELNWVGEYRTMVNKYKTFRCSECKALGRSAMSDMTTQQRKNQLRPV